MRDVVAEWLVRDYGFAQAKTIAKANIAESRAKGYWRRILEAIYQLEKDERP